MWKIFSFILILTALGLISQASFFLVETKASGSYLPRLDLIKGSGPEVYVLEKGTRHWIPDIEIFNKFNFKWENIKTYSDSFIQNYPQDDDWSGYDDYPEGSLVKGSGSEVYLIELGKKRWIPSPAVFLNNNFGWKYILNIDNSDLDDYDLGEILSSNEPNRYPDTSITSGPKEGEIIETGEIEFRYSGANPLGSAGDLTFETYLKGIDNEWKNQGSSYTESYNLSDEVGSSYAFFVRAKNKEGYYDPTPAKRNFQIGVSPYYQKVEIKNIEYEKSSFTDDYIVLKNESDGNINLAGWTIQTKLGEVDIPQAVEKLGSSFSSSYSTVVELEPNGKLVVTAGLSPIGVGFLTNKCTGYLDHDRFDPSLDNDCPVIDSSEYSSFKQHCKDFINNLSRCELPDYAGNLDISGDSQCTSFLNQNFNYSSCYSDYSLDPDFYKDEWRAFWGRTSRAVFSKVSDTVILYDQNGLKVDEYTYN